MNYSLILFILGSLLKVEGCFLLLPVLVDLFYKENVISSYLLVAGVCLILGGLASHKRPERGKLYPRDGLIIVALGWIVLSVFGALPFVMTGDIPDYVDALFETISGFTTTGASILSDVEALTHASLFWRSFTHWVGGMGVFVFVMAVLPMLGGSTMNLMKAESPGPSVDKLVPHVKDTASILYGLYLGMTVLEVIFLMLGGMTMFEALTTSFGTVGTGGFGVYNSSMGGFSPYLQNVVTVFMILSGINYAFYFCLISGKLLTAIRMEEVRTYLLVILVAIVAICIDSRHVFQGFFDMLGHVSFQVASIITTTGFSTTDFDLWPQFSKTILVILMFVGACAGSTGGGIKISRLMILFKSMRKELSLIVHPREIKKIRIDDRSLTHEVVRSTNVFMVIYFAILFISVLLIGVDEKDFTTNFTAVVATLNNIGPGLELVGPTQNFGFFSHFSKFVLMFDMLAGRLELFPMLILFMPSSWKKSK